ncbi:MAG: acetylglutamate kinase [Candidatus Binatia bacterium]|nr:acetylglutamate kinase [Candidatus Binatia bacterium]MDG1958625.1 acetylglutamate kinase [Candidatus Binatia bacterium]MDG2009066.1 acetylglutamate kinase [Candidatus Binatia bacterium]
MDQATIIQNAEILLEALPYIKRFAGKTIVIKYGGNAMIADDLQQAFAEDLVLLKYVGIHPVVVHGGGPQINRMLEELAIESRFVGGMRVTDPPTMRVVEMVLAGEINARIVTNIQQAGGRAAGFSGKDGGLLQAQRLRHAAGDLGQVGEITAVDPGLIRAMEGNDFIPVIAPVGSSQDGESLNINADTAAGRIAEALGAEKFLLLTDVEGILDRNRQLITSLNADQAAELIEDGTIEGGMLPKIACCLQALRGGVSQVHILDGRIKHALLLELFTDSGVGTAVHLPATDGAEP